MKELIHKLLKEEYFKENNIQDTMNYTQIIKYIKDLTPNKEDVPTYFLNNIKKSKDNFKLYKVKISDILNMDVSVKEYVKSGEDRYSDLDFHNEFLPHPNEAEDAIVVFNNEVMDGYSRISELYRRGEKYVNVWSNKKI